MSTNRWQHTQRKYIPLKNNFKMLLSFSKYISFSGENSVKLIQHP